MTDMTDQFDRLVEQAFPGDPLAKYHASVTVHINGDISVTYKGEKKTIYQDSPTAALLPEGNP